MGQIIILPCLFFVCKENYFQVFASTNSLELLFLNSTSLHQASYIIYDKFGPFKKSNNSQQLKRFFEIALNRFNLGIRINSRK